MWGLFIFLLTSIPNPPVPSQLPRWSDKVVHFALYAVLAALIAFATRHWSPWRGFAFLFITICAFALVDELHQHWIPGRAADRADWIADVAGGTVGGLVTFARPTRKELRS